MGSETEQDKPSCRICFHSKISKANPLITPCECKGSMAFVHLSCLTRWMRMNPANNNNQCELCLTNYQILEHSSLEIIPSENKSNVFVLRFPFILSLCLHYIWIYHGSFLNRDFKINTFHGGLYLAYQWIFQFLYLILFLRERYIKNPDMYWQEYKKVSYFLYFMIYLTLLICLHSEMYVAGPILNLYIGGIWNLHVNALRNINKRILLDDSN